MPYAITMHLSDVAKVALYARVNKERRNASTIASRALQLYALVQASRDAGDVIEFVKLDGTRERLLQQ